MKAQLLDTWQVHSSKNKLLLDNTTETGMQQTLSNRGGRTVYQQWAHIHNVRLQWLEACAPDLYKKYKPIGKDSAFDRELLAKSLDDSARGIAELLNRSWENSGKVKGFAKGVIPLLGYFISHESHHRGNILLTLKQSGEKIPDTVKWGLWEWAK